MKPTAIRCWHSDVRSITAHWTECLCGTNSGYGKRQNDRMLPWPNDPTSPHQPIVPTTPSRRTRSIEPKPFAGLTQRPPCALCEREATPAHEPPPAPPEPMPPTHRRPRTVDTSQHFC